jgi:hypothetical protein
MSTRRSFDDRQNIQIRFDCETCSAFYPEDTSSLNVKVNDSEEGEGRLAEHQLTRGPLLPLKRHACAINGDTSKCCIHHESSNRCGLFYNNYFLYPCGGCYSFKKLSQQQQQQSPERPAHPLSCSLCKTYYPQQEVNQEHYIRIDNDKRDWGKKEMLKRHSCAIEDDHGDTSNCCVYDSAINSCLVNNDDDNFGALHPCGSCSSDLNLFIIAYVLFMLILGFCICACIRGCWKKSDLGDSLSRRIERRRAKQHETEENSIDIVDNERNYYGNNQIRLRFPSHLEDKVVLLPTPTEEKQENKNQEE